MIEWIAQTSPTFSDVSTFGMAGLMGAMWLWERNSSRQREQQLDEAHTRITGDRVQLDLLIDVVRQNAEAMATLTTTQEQLLAQVRDIRSAATGTTGARASKAHSEGT